MYLDPFKDGKQEIDCTKKRCLKEIERKKKKK